MIPKQLSARKDRKATEQPPLRLRDYNASAFGGPNMPVALPEPDGEREGIPLWLCPNCDQFKPLQDYGWKKRDDICPGQQVWFKQGWCNRCLQSLAKATEVR